MNAIIEAMLVGMISGIVGCVVAMSLVFGMAALRSIGSWVQVERWRRRTERQRLQNVAMSREKQGLVKHGPGIQGLGIGVRAPRPGTTKRETACVKRKPIAVSMHDSPGWVQSSNNGLTHRGLYLLRIYLN